MAQNLLILALTLFAAPSFALSLLCRPVPNQADALIVDLEIVLNEGLGYGEAIVGLKESDGYRENLRYPISYDTQSYELDFHQLSFYSKGNMLKVVYSFEEKVWKFTATTTDQTIGKGRTVQGDFTCVNEEEIAAQENNSRIEEPLHE